MRKRSLKIGGHATSITLEEPFWQALKDLAAAQGKSVNALVAELDAGRGAANLSSALRLYILRELQGKITDPA